MSEGRPFTALRGRDRFKRVFRVGSRATVGGVTVIAVAGDPGPSAVGIVASRSVGNAVTRNRARRRLREAIAAAGPPPGLDIVVVATKKVIEAPFGEVVGWLRAAMSEEAGE